MVVPCRAQLQQSIWNLSSWRDTLMKDTFAFELSDNATTVSRTLGSEHDARRWGNIERISRTVLCLEFLVQLFRLILDVPLEEIFMFFYEISVHAGCVNTCMWQVVDGGWRNIIPTFRWHQRQYCNMYGHVFFTSNSCRWGLKQPASTVPKCNANGSLPNWSVLGHDMTC